MFADVRGTEPGHGKGINNFRASLLKVTINQWLDAKTALLARERCQPRTSICRRMATGCADFLATD
ncbi:hypothetical protein [Chitinolyticbacter meiyuanensis]|uniref:hypothetical protein n=1 Tax=Chitinolyticbacter meiyuanensis TaxID=682798 RepID=UPI0016520B2B|nr:hypothetical protein [Chitinolyticbacter meiyuanensis]